MAYVNNYVVYTINYKTEFKNSQTVNSYCLNYKKVKYYCYFLRGTETTIKLF